MFDRRERAHSRESGIVTTTLLHGPVVVGVPRVGEVFRELRAEVLEGRERRGEPVVGVEMDGLLRRRRVVGEALRAVMAFSRATRGQRAVAFILFLR